jgi:hypothetical protein
MKKYLALLLVLTLIGTGSAFAVNNNTVTVDGAPLEKMFIEDANGAILLPLKAISEAFGYEVKWFATDKHIELIKGARFITIKTTENAYTFAKMAPVALSSKATIKDGTTYVPMEFVEKFLEGGVFESNEGLEITSGIDDQVSTSNLVIQSIEDGRIIAKHFDSEAHIMLSNETTYSDYATQVAIKLSDLKVGDTLKVTHSSIMIMIYPPQYGAFHIERVNDVGYTEGTILSVSENSFLIKGSLMTIQINLSKETKLENTNGDSMTLSQLRVGNQVQIYHSLAMTKSIPPQTQGIKIIVDSSVK